MATVCVTAAGGFVGSHICKQLLEKGYRVRGTVRDASNTEKNGFLTKMVPDAKFPIELFSADLEKEGSFDDAIDGCEYVIHTASVVKLTAPDPQKEIIDPSLNGLKNVLRSCHKASSAGTLKRYVQTSSIAAVMDVERPRDHIYTEDDWNESVTLATEPYSLSKVLTEREANAFVAALPASERFAVAFINPGAIYGPVLNRSHMQSSPQIIYDLMTGAFPLCPNFGFAVVDVRDVAKAHILAMENESIEGRFICVSDTLWLKELSALMKKEFPQYSFPTRGLPNFLMYCAAVFDKRVNFPFLRRNLGFFRKCANDKIRSSLQMEFVPVRDMLRDTCLSFLELEIVPDKRKK